MMKHTRKKLKIASEKNQTASFSDLDLPSQLSSQYSLCAEILSYLVHNTKDLAHLRLISRTWNRKVFPYVLKSSGFVKNCYPNTDFVDGLLKLSQWDEYQDSHFFNLESLGMSLFEEGGVIDSLVLIQFDPSIEISFTGDLALKVDLLKKLCEKNPEFRRLSKEALKAGVFLSVQELEQEQEKYETSKDLPSAAAIITQRVPRETCIIDRSGDVPIVLFHAAHQGQDSNIFPFYEHGAYKGYITKESEEFVTCLIPLCIEYTQTGMNNILGHKTILNISLLWNMHQENTIVTEGIALADSILPETLHQNLTRDIDDLVEKKGINNQPYSNEIMSELVDPGLYPFIRGKSLVVQHQVMPPEKLVSTKYQIETPDTDFWGRAYEAGAKYQWLPTYFKVEEDGTCSISDYINDLVPKSRFESLYSSIEQLFSHALPLIESTVSYARIARQRIRHSSGYSDIRYDDNPIEPIEENPYFLRGKRIQVVTKIVDYKLNQGQTYEGFWHTEGMSHEEVIATAAYYIYRDDDIVGGDVLFKRAFHNDEARYIYSNIDQMRHRYIDRVILDGLVPLGKVETLPKRLLVFPNSHVCKVTEITNQSASFNSSLHGRKRRVVVFYIINPEKRIISTREVPPQQEELGGSMSRENARAHKVEVIKERMNARQDWNVREIPLHRLI